MFSHGDCFVSILWLSLSVKVPIRSFRRGDVFAGYMSRYTCSYTLWCSVGTSLIVLVKWMWTQSPFLSAKGREIRARMRRVKGWKCAQEEAWAMAPKRTKEKADREQEPTSVTICYWLFLFSQLDMFFFSFWANRENSVVWSIYRFLFRWLLSPDFSLGDHSPLFSGYVA